MAGPEAERFEDGFDEVYGGGVWATADDSTWHELGR